MMQRGQGAIEYLLILAAAIVVVGIVIGFLITTVSTTEETGSTQTFDYLCTPPPDGLGSTTLNCRCYRQYKEDNGLQGGADEGLTLATDCCSGDVIEPALKDIICT